MASNPFAALSLIVAPAILTNASSVLIMSTSNRLARAADRARSISTELESGVEMTSERVEEQLRELTAAEQRSILLVRALRCFYGALGGFACAAFVSLLGAIVTGEKANLASQILEIVAVAAGFVAVGNLVLGSAILLKETRIAVTILQERATHLRQEAEERSHRLK